ncbi:MAG: hypothetical protein JSU98_02905 [Gemmatimonadales bacterium]|jgi:hypothetical protein|nr:MAG: hypothetical protein JSU98_02905 [Gemmatimonadales bacterium]
MNDRIPYTSGTDPIHRDDPVLHETEIPVLGIPTRYRSNSAAVIDAAEESFGAWRSLDKRDVTPGPGTTVTLFVHDGTEGPEPHAPVRYRTLDGRRMLLATRGSQAVVEPLRRDALGWVTPELVQDRDHFRYSWLDALTYAVLSPRDRYPLHAAGVARGGALLLLAGPSGVGKSTLSYTAARRGMSVVAEDLIHLQLHPTLRVWGLTTQLNLLASSRVHFPELRNRPTTLLARGEEKLKVDLRTLGAVPPRPVFDQVAVCLLTRDRQPGRPCLEVLDQGELLDGLDPGYEIGFDIFQTEIRAGLEQLSAKGGWRLRLGPDPTPAVPLLEELLASLVPGGGEGPP